MRLIVLATIALVIADRFGLVPGLGAITTTLYQWMLFLGAFSLLLGVVNVIGEHLHRIQSGAEEWFLSVLLILALLIVLVAGLLAAEGLENPVLIWVFDSIIAPGQAAVYALTGFFLAAAAYRFLRIGRRGGLWITIGALFTLLAQLPFLPRQIGILPLDRLSGWLMSYPVMATMRGLLIGTTLATILVIIRFLFTSSTGHVEQKNNQA